MWLVRFLNHFASNLWLISLPWYDRLYNIINIAILSISVNYPVYKTWLSKNNEMIDKQDTHGFKQYCIRLTRRPSEANWSLARGRGVFALRHLIPVTDLTLGAPSTAVGYIIAPGDRANALFCGNYLSVAVYFNRAQMARALGSHANAARRKSAP